MQYHPSRKIVRLAVGLLLSAYASLALLAAPIPSFAQSAVRQTTTNLVKVEGVVTAMTPTSITIGVVTVDTSGVTVPRGVAVGQRVEMYANAQPGSLWSALRIELEDDADDLNDDDLLEIRGRIEAVNDDLVSVGGVNFSITGARVRGSFAIGDYIDLKFSALRDGTLVITTLDARDDDILDMNDDDDDSNDDRGRGSDDDDSNDDRGRGSDDDSNDDNSGGSDDDSNDDNSGGSDDDSNDDNSGGSDDDSNDDNSGGNDDDSNDDNSGGSDDDSNDDNSGGSDDDSNDDDDDDDDSDDDDDDD
jgi:hypothetical protein